MKRPLAMNRVDRELRNRFIRLMEAMKVVNTNREEIAYEALNLRILQEVTEKPILARIIASRAGVGAGVSLLFAACSKLNLDTSHDVIKSLIQAYPRALITWASPENERTTPLYMIAEHPQHCVLMPWIAINYTQFLDHEFDRLGHPGFAHGLLEMYKRRGNTSCTATIVKDFFEAYPRALNQIDYGFNMLHKLGYYQNGKECEADLFKLMAERCPSSALRQTDSRGYTPLHHACDSLVRHKGRDSVKICKYLIQTCPESVRVEASFTTRYGSSAFPLPFHILRDKCGHRSVREVVVCLLREYPESYDERAARLLPPGYTPFSHRVKSYLNEEKELKENIASLEDSSSSFTEAVTCTNDKLIRSASTVFDSWTTSFINSTEDKVKLISTQLQDLCNEGNE